MYKMILLEPVSFFYGKRSNFNELYLAHSGFQKVTRLYPMNFSSGIQPFENINELRVEKHFHSFF